MAAPKQRHSGMFKKGQSGNPKGRPRNSKSVTGLIRELAEQEREGGKADREVIAENLIALAKAGEQWAIKEFLDRMDGKATQHIEQDVTSNGRALGARIQFVSESSEIVDTTAEPIEDARELEAGE